MSNVTLHDYQNYCVDFVLDHPSSLLLLDMGLGKTLITLKTIETLKDMFNQHYKVLVIAPLTVAKNTWPDEIENFEFDLTYTKVLGSQQQRLDALTEEVDIYLINRENVTWLVDHYKKEWPFDFIVIDELSSFKSSKSKRFKSLRKVRGKAKRFVGLTGTPAPNNLMDLWSQVYLADGGERLEKTITKYRMKYFYPEKSNGHVVYQYGLKDGAEDVIHEQISDITISMKAKDVLTLPKRVDNIIKVEMAAKERKHYTQMKKDYLLDLDGEEIEASNAAVLSGKLLQMANGAVYSDEQNIVDIHEQKIEALERIVADAQGEPILVFYQYKHDLAKIKKAFPEAVELDDNLKAWNNKKIPILLVHPQSAGHGLNLQKGGHIIVWYGLNWSLEYYQQANARLDRQGQEQSVIVHHIVTKDTIDELVIDSLKNKEVNQEKLIAAVKAEMGVSA